MYHLDRLGNVIRSSDNVTVPNDNNNIDCHDYLAWLSDGNTPAPYNPNPASPRDQALNGLAESDKDLARIAEDLIALLISKGIIAAADLPQLVRDKLDNRRELRNKL